MRENKVILDSTFSNKSGNNNIYKMFRASGVVITTEKRKATEASKPVMGRLGVIRAIAK